MYNHFLTAFVITLSLILTSYFFLSLSITLVFVSIPLFLCKIMIVPKIVNKMIVQITQLSFKIIVFKTIREILLYIWASQEYYYKKLCAENTKSNKKYYFFKNNKQYGKFYGTPNFLSVLVHQITKLIVKCVIFLREKLFSITYNYNN